MKAISIALVSLHSRLAFAQINEARDPMNRGEYVRAVNILSKILARRPAIDAYLYPVSPLLKTDIFTNVGLEVEPTRVPDDGEPLPHIERNFELALKSIHTFAEVVHAFIKPVDTLVQTFLKRIDAIR